MSPVEPDDVQHVIDRERALLSSLVRRSAQHVDRLLDPDFREIGASGRQWTREETAAALAAESSDAAGAIPATDFQGAVVGPDLVLLTYVSNWQGRRARRSSLWRRSAGTWRMLYHQGTPIEGT